jgi:hypothetical protein
LGQVGLGVESGVSTEDSITASIVVSAVSFVHAAAVCAGPVSQPWHAS